MFSSLIQKAYESDRARDAYYTSLYGPRFDDPVAMETGWRFIDGGGTGKVKSFYEVGRDRLELRPTMGEYILVGTFIFLGASLIAYTLYYALSVQRFDFPIFLAIFFGSIFAGIGGLVFRFGFATLIFDRRNGFYRDKGNPVFDFPKDIEMEPSPIKSNRIHIQMYESESSLRYLRKLENIYAVQLLSKSFQGGHENNIQYEMNVVFNNGRRAHVMSAQSNGNGSRKSHQDPDAVITDQGVNIREQATKLSNFLKKPLWDITPAW